MWCKRKSNLEYVIFGGNKLKKIQAEVENQIQRHLGLAFVNDIMFSQINLKEVDFYFEPKDIDVTLKQLAEIIADERVMPKVLWPIAIVVIYVTKTRIPVTFPEYYWIEISLEIERVSAISLSIGTVEDFFLNIFQLIFHDELSLPNDYKLKSQYLDVEPDNSNFHQSIYKRTGITEGYLSWGYLDMPTI